MAAVVMLVAGACGSTRVSLPSDPVVHGTGGAKGTGGTSGGGAGGFRSAGGGAGGSSVGVGGGPGIGGRDGGAGGDAPFCCPPDPTMSGCMHLGGQSDSGGCWLTCDFFCSSNWRIEPDSHGCPVWHYDFNPCDPPFLDARPDRRD